jgi:hypothetical protein
MTYRPVYADGTPMREGDWVRMEGGAVVGRISEVIESRERALDRQLQGVGVVVDAQPKGFVFLSEPSLAEAGLQLVRRGPSEGSRRTLALSLGIGAFLVLPVLYSFASALYSALATGYVLVISLGRYETARELVAWQAAWARFAGPMVLVASFLAFDGSRGLTLRWWLAGAGSVLALILLAFSLWFTTMGRSLAFAALVAFVAIASVIGHRVGRVAAFLFIAACAGFLVWRVTHAI